MTDASTPLRQFNEQGVEQFRTYLSEIRAGTRIDLPDGFTNDPALTRTFAQDLRVTQRSFATTFEMVQYLHPLIDTLSLPGKYYDVGLWAWLSAFYFDLLCPIENGTRQIGKETRYIPPTIRNYRNALHLLGAPMRLYDTHKGKYATKAPLSLSPDKSTLMFDRIMGSQDLAMNIGILEAITLLYWDEDAQRLKPGSSSRNQPGSIFRFVSLINQFNLTFDLFSMNGKQIVDLLPKHEFARWVSL